MDNLGDWLYIVFLVIAVISGLFSSGKKKKAEAKQAQPRPKQAHEAEINKEKGFWEILEEMQNRPERTQKPQVKNISPPPRKNTPATNKAKASPAQFLTAEANIPALTRKPPEHPILEEESEPVYSLTSEDFNTHDVEEVRKAIIYNEILNRKY